MSLSMTKAERVREMERLYYQRAYSDIEMAQRFGVDRTTIFRDRTGLEAEAPIVQDEDGRYRIDRNKYLSSIRVNLTEALSLYLAARRASQQTRYAQRDTASALEKLALTLRQPMTEQLVKAASGILLQQVRPEREAVLATIAEAWVQGFCLRITYRGLQARRTFQHTVRPYLLEPSPWSDSVYLIGHSDRMAKVAIFKLDRIERAVMTGEQFTFPSDFDEQQMLRYAWGIWGGDEEPVTVKLRFAPGIATRRVRESVWHPLEKVTATDDGGCVWEAPIAEWREMLPWVRGWGADVEVMAPEKLRDEVVAEVYRMARSYGIDIVSAIDPMIQRVLQCWGKTNDTDSGYHPALFHMIDVANVAAHLLTLDAPSRFRSVLAQAMNAEDNSLAAWVPWIVGLHDIGKITASFQMQNAKQKTRLQQEGFSFAGWSQSDDKPHSVFSEVFIQDVLSQLSPKPVRSLQRAITEMIGGHHGAYHSKSLVRHAGALLATIEPTEWRTLRITAEKALRNSFLKGDIADLPQPQNISVATMALSGFAILCDWIGSDSRFFTPQPEMELERYVRHSRRQAEKALHASGLYLHSMSAAPRQFSALFTDIAHPRPLQLAVDDIPNQLLTTSCLVIIEAPTGEGKTEAALGIAHRLAQITRGDDFFYALPTIATSNQMYGRLHKHVHNRLGLGVQVKLAHGQSFLIEDSLRIEPLENGNISENDNPKDAPIQWFNGKKRSLLAPFGVGTVDQAEMAALNARHLALRMFGLMGKVVIIDEVHAYDTYMTTIIEQLLRWLSATGTSVILMSATLPLSRRRQLAQAYGVNWSDDSSLSDAYPSLVVLSRNGVYHASPAPWQADRTVNLGRLYLDDEQAEQKAQWLLEAVQEGGCACWITNTVRRAQRIFAHLQAAAPSYVDLSLLHAQFPLENRQALEEQIIGKYGPDGMRPSHGIVIGTQVLEQSLDLDFDVMASDVAPIDLLLQRAGRLHRHKRNRPAKHQRPYLWVNLHHDEQPMIPPLADCRMYTEYILRLSWEALANLAQINLPLDYRPLIEAVYNAPIPGEVSPLHGAWKKLHKIEEFAVQEANTRLIPDPDPATPFSYALTQKTFEEDENSAAWIVARTRLGEESLNVIPMEVQTRNGTLPDGVQISLDDEANREIQLRLLRRGLRISHQDAIQAIRAINTERCRLFKDSTLLRDHFLLPLENNRVAIRHNGTVMTFTLHPQLGLIIERQKE